MDGCLLYHAKFTLSVEAGPIEIMDFIIRHLELGSCHYFRVTTSSGKVIRWNNYRSFWSHHPTPPFNHQLKRGQPCWVNLPSSPPNNGGEVSRACTVFTSLQGHSSRYSTGPFTVCRGDAKKITHAPSQRGVMKEARFEPETVYQLILKGCWCAPSFAVSDSWELCRRSVE